MSTWGSSNKHRQIQVSLSLKLVSGYVLLKQKKYVTGICGSKSGCLAPQSFPLVCAALVLIHELG